MEVVESKKKTYMKRKSEIMKEIEVKSVESPEVPEPEVPEPEVVELPKKPTENEEEPPTKRTRITKEDDCPTAHERPCWMRGAIVKPLLIAGVASLSFWVNNFYQTTRPPPAIKKNTVQTEKKNLQGLQRPTFVFQSKPDRPSLVPGFTTN
jgi:hypothetical protein